MGGVSIEVEEVIGAINVEVEVIEVEVGVLRVIRTRGVIAPTLTHFDPNVDVHLPSVLAFSATMQLRVGVSVFVETAITAP